MAEENGVYEITQMLGNRQQVQNDMLEAMGGIVNVFQKKYVDKIHEVVGSHQKEAMKNPSKEVQLLSALKLFSDSKTHGQIDRAIHAIYVANAAKSITRELSVAGAKPDYQSMGTADHADGVYEIDESCARKAQHAKQADPSTAAGLVLFMSLLGFI